MELYFKDDGPPCEPITEINVVPSDPALPDVLRVIKGEDVIVDTSWDGTAPFQISYRMGNVFTPSIGALTIPGNSLVANLGPPVESGTIDIMLHNECSTIQKQISMTCAECETVTDIIENPLNDPFNGTITLDALGATTQGVGNFSVSPAWIWIHDGSGGTTKGPITFGDWTLEVNSAGEIEATSSGPTSQNLDFQWCVINPVYDCETVGNGSIEFSCTPASINTTYPDLNITDGDSVSITVPVSGTPPYNYSIDVDCGSGPFSYLGPFSSSNTNYPFTFTPAPNLDGCEFIVNASNSCGADSESFIINIDSPFGCDPVQFTSFGELPDAITGPGGYYSASYTVQGTAPYNFVVERSCGGASFSTIESFTSSSITNFINDGPHTCSDSPCIYRVTATNDCGTDVSEGTLTIEDENRSPTISCPSSVTRGDSVPIYFYADGSAVDITLQYSVSCTGTYLNANTANGVVNHIFNIPTNNSTPNQICYRIFWEGECDSGFTDVCTVDFEDCQLPVFSTLWQDQTAQAGALVTLPYNVTGPVTLRIWRNCPGSAPVLVSGPVTWGGGANSWSYTAQTSIDGCTFELEATNSCGSTSTFSTLTIDNPPPVCDGPTVTGCPTNG